MQRIVLPLRVNSSKNKKFTLNLNIYRNAHYHTLNNAKIDFSEKVFEEVSQLNKVNKCLIRYFFYPGTARKTDVSNVCSIVDKFFCDVLVEAGILPDDNYEHVLGVSFEFVEIDRKNPRVEAEIIPLE